MTTILKRKFGQTTFANNNHQSQSLAKARGIKKLKKECLKKPYPQGHKFSEDDKKNILHIFHTLKTDKAFLPLLDADTHELTSLLFGCSKITVKKVIDNNGVYKDHRKNRFIQEKEIPVKYRDQFQAEVRKGLEKGVRLTCNVFKKILFRDNINVSTDTIARKLRDWGLRWGSLTEKDYRRKGKEIVSLREAYLQNLRCFESEGRERVYLDESFINKNHSYNRGWFILEEGKEIYKPMGLGPRVAIMGAITQEGWLGTRRQCIKKSLRVLRTGKIHLSGSVKYWHVKKQEHNVNSAVFKEYFVNCILPNLKKPSIIIMDNAKYHRAYPPHIFKPRASSKKKDLEDYISSQGEDSQNQNKPELLKLAKRLFGKEKNEIQTLAEGGGHVVLYPPPYHPELNPIEFCWGYVKGRAAENVTYTLNSLTKGTLPNAFASLPSDIIMNFWGHVKKEGGGYPQMIPGGALTRGRMHEEDLGGGFDSIYDEDSEESELTDVSYESETETETDEYDSDEFD